MDDINRAASVPFGKRYDAPGGMSAESSSLVLRCLCAMIALLIAAFIATHLLGLQGYRNQMGMLRLFNMDGEGTLPAWFSSTLMLASAMLLAIAGYTSPAGTLFRRHWYALAAGFVFLSADETAGLHEMLNRPAHAAGLHLNGLFAAPWVVLGLVGVVFVALVFMRFAMHLDSSTRIRFATAALVFLGGAIGVESIGAAIEVSQALNLQTGDWMQRSDFSIEYMTTVAIEEGLELLGLSLFIDALLKHLGANPRLNLARAPS